jgi:NAD(P)-dependent dehydrogenase (short-subunit alcohol dehydrogenase family)
MKLKDKVAIVTGGASGIGAASARLFAAEGARIALVDLDPLGLGQVAADIEGTGGQAITITADVSQGEPAREGVERVMEKWGRVDVLMTAAGISLGGTVDAVSEATWDRTFAVNVKGTYLWVHHAIRPMIAARSGAIVTVGSQLAQSSLGKNAAYVASKGAIASFTKTIAVDHAPQGIPHQRPDARCHRHADAGALAPPPGRPRGGARGLEAAPSAGPHRPARGGRAAALFLASDDSSFVTGTLLFVDGGWTAH